MFWRGIGTWAILGWLFLSPLLSFAGEMYRWTDDKGVVHFTDDPSQIPAKYHDQLEKREMKEEGSGTGDKRTVPERGQGIATETFKPSVKPQEKPGQGKEDLDAYERKIEGMKAVEKKIAELEEELRTAEERIKELKEKEEYSRPVTRYKDGFRDRVPIQEPPSERDRLFAKIMNLKKQIKALEDQLSQIKRGL